MTNDVDMNRKREVVEATPKVTTRKYVVHIPSVFCLFLYSFNWFITVKMSTHRVSVNTYYSFIVWQVGKAVTRSPTAKLRTEKFVN